MLEAARRDELFEHIYSFVKSLLFVCLLLSILYYGENLKTTSHSIHSPRNIE
jgi:hypothetical protein